MVLTTIFLVSCQENLSFLLEVENFETKGGWLVDPQFVEQMGSPYLMAHGLGEAVENAFTEIHPEYPGKLQRSQKLYNYLCL